MSRLFLIIALSTSVFTSNVFACGGQDATDAEILGLPYARVAQEKMSSTFGTSVVVESVVRSGNEILNLDKQSVARARCNANYINVYLTSEEPSQLLCMITFQVNHLGEADFNGLKPGLICRQANDAKPRFIEID